MKKLNVDNKTWEILKHYSQEHDNLGLSASLKFLLSDYMDLKEGLDGERKSI